MAETPAKTRAKPVDDEAHFRIDELVRQLKEMQRWATAEHMAGVAHGAVMEVMNKMPKDAAALVMAMHAQTDAINRLIEILGTPTTRTCTLNLSSGPVELRVTESRPAAPWLMKGKH